MATLHGLKLQSGAPTSPYVLMLVFSKALKYALHKPTPTSICLTVLECAAPQAAATKKKKKKQQQLLLLLLRVCVVGGCLLCQIECREWCGDASGPSDCVLDVACRIHQWCCHRLMLLLLLLLLLLHTSALVKAVHLTTTLDALMAGGTEHWASNCSFLVVLAHQAAMLLALSSTLVWSWQARSVSLVFARSIADIEQAACLPATTRVASCQTIDVPLVHFSLANTQLWMVLTDFVKLWPGENMCEN
jgi:hypothetical protein